MYPSHGPLRLITSHSRFSLAIIICYSQSSFLAQFIPCCFYSFYCCPQVIQMWSPLLDYDLKGVKSKSYSVHLSPENHRHVQLLLYFQNASTWSPFQTVTISTRASDLRPTQTFSLRRNLCKGHFPCHCDRNYQNSPLQFIRRTHLIQLFTEISFWPTTVYFNNCINQNHNKILLSYWLSALIIRVVKQNRTTVYQFCHLISWLYFVNTSPR